MDINYNSLCKKLLQSEHPEIRWKILKKIHNLADDSPEIITLQKEIQHSTITKTLLQNMDSSGEIISKTGCYDKWQGAHWIFVSLADNGYPKRDQRLAKTANNLLNYWTADHYFSEFEAKTKADVYKKDLLKSGVPVMEGRYRRCASQQGYCLYYLLKLGFDNQGIHKLAERLLHWQWPDGGWNCDKDPKASTSTLIHTAIALKGLVEYNKRYPNKDVDQAIKRSSEFILKRHLFRKLSDNSIIKDQFTKLHYPLYWHYDILGTLKIFCESGDIMDSRCDEAIDLILDKYIPDQGWPAEKKYYRSSNKLSLGNDYIDWGGTSKRKANPWITADVLYVLRSRGVF